MEQFIYTTQRINIYIISYCYQITITKLSILYFHHRFGYSVTFKFITVDIVNKYLVQSMFQMNKNYITGMNNTICSDSRFIETLFYICVNQICLQAYNNHIVVNAPCLSTTNVIKPRSGRCLREHFANYPDLYYTHEYTTIQVMFSSLKEYLFFCSLL